MQANQTNICIEEVPMDNDKVFHKVSIIAYVSCIVPLIVLIVNIANTANWPDKGSYLLIFTHLSLPIVSIIGCLVLGSYIAEVDSWPKVIGLVIVVSILVYITAFIFTIPVAFVALIVSLFLVLVAALLEGNYGAACTIGVILLIGLMAIFGSGAAKSISVTTADGKEEILSEQAFRDKYGD